jgi:hypothetical protein
VIAGEASRSWHTEKFMPSFFEAAEDYDDEKLV